MTDLRQATFRDWDALGRVAYQTAYFGEGAARFFPDEALFEDLWTSPYRLTPHDAFVAEQAGEVTGSIIGAPEQAAYARAVTATLLARVLPKLLTGRYRRPFSALPYLWRLQRNPAPHADWARYPAHLHVNLLPQTRGAGVGGALLEAYLGALRRRSVPGVQLSTTLDNAAALRLYARAGFTVHAQRSTDLWTPWLGRPTVLVVMVKAL